MYVHNNKQYHYMAACGWPAGRLAGWLAGWLPGFIDGWLVGWLAIWNKGLCTKYYVLE